MSLLCGKKCVLSRSPIISWRKRESWLLYFNCIFASVCMCVCLCVFDSMCSRRHCVVVLEQDTFILA